MTESKVTVTAEFTLTPEQVAESFWELGSEQQAQFFFHLWKISGGMLGMQAIYMRESCEKHESVGALWAFQEMAAHAYKFGFVDQKFDQWDLPDYARKSA